MSEKVKLPSGTELVIQLAPFSDGKKLYQSVLRELQKVDIENGTKLTGDDFDVKLLKDMFCILLSSSDIEERIHECMKRCTYGGHRISDVNETFEPEEARQDYILACYEVARVNIHPFGKSLFAKLSQAIEALTQIVQK